MYIVGCKIHEWIDSEGRISRVHSNITFIVLISRTGV